MIIRYAGIVDISLRPSHGTTIDICLSSIRIYHCGRLIAEIIKAFRTKIAYSDAHCPVKNSIALSRIIYAYSQMIVNGNMEIYTVHGMMLPMIYRTVIPIHVCFKH